MNILAHIFIMAGVTYLIRVIPFTVFRKKIRSRFILSFLHYVPYAVLSAMTIPAIFYSTGSMATMALPNTWITSVSTRTTRNSTIYRAFIPRMWK